MNKNLPRIAVALMVAAGSVAASADVRASGSRTNPAETAVPVPLSDSSCIQLYYGAIKNVCSRNLSVDFPLPYDGDNAGYIYFWFYGLTPSGSSGKVACTMVGASFDLSQFYYGQGASITATGQWQIATGQYFKPTLEPQLYANCVLPPNGMISGINWEWP